MTNNRTRGRIGENEFAKLVGGRRISRTGEPGSDCLDSEGRSWEVKRTKTLPANIRGWVQQASAQGDFGIAFRADRSEWYLLIPLKNWQADTRQLRLLVD